MKYSLTLILFIVLSASSLCQPNCLPTIHTASANVSLLDSAFPAPQLQGSKKIWIYLPASYAVGKKSYPVIYINEAQHVFDEYGSACGEWGVDECMDSLVTQGKPAAIVVVIEKDGGNIPVYDPDANDDLEKAANNNYLDFLVRDLKPYVDKHYRTLSSKENTIIAGSSTGGSMAWYAMLRYPGYFGKAGIFSPPQLQELTDSAAATQAGKFFFYTCGLQNDDSLNTILSTQEDLGENSSAIVYSVTDPAAIPNEQAWGKWFAEFYCWIMADGFNNVIRVER